jgi:hypothetical protein
MIGSRRSARSIRIVIPALLTLLMVVLFVMLAACGDNSSGC